MLASQFLSRLRSLRMARCSVTPRRKFSVTIRTWSTAGVRRTLVSSLTLKMATVTNPWSQTWPLTTRLVSQETESICEREHTMFRVSDRLGQEKGIISIPLMKNNWQHSQDQWEWQTSRSLSVYFHIKSGKRCVVVFRGNEEGINEVQARSRGSNTRREISLTHT